MSAYETIKIVEENEVVSLVLNRPPVNVLNIAMMKEVNAALQELQKHPTAKVLLVRAEGKAFSAGVDIADHTAERVDEMMREFHRIFDLLSGFRIPTIAAVDGAALGGGCELAVFCDIAIASERAKFGQPEIKVGVFPPVSTALFPRLMGRNRALQWLLTGETMTAAEAERIGLIAKTFPTEGFADHIAAFLAGFAAQSRVVLELTKRAVDAGLQMSCLEAVSAAEDVYMNELLKTEDAHEGLAAFMEKRQPVWKNR